METKKCSVEALLLLICGVEHLGTDIPGAAPSVEIVKQGLHFY